MMRARARLSFRDPRERPPLPRVRMIGGRVDRRLYYLGCALVVASILFHLPLLLVAGCALLLVLAATDIWARYCLHSVDYQRHFSSQRALFGEEITFAISLENAKLLPLSWLELDDTLPRGLTFKGYPVRSGLTSNKVSLECLFSLRWYERVIRRYSIQCTNRGIHAFGPATLRSGDVFGFLSREMRIEAIQYVLVYPLVVPLSSFPLPSRHPFGERRAPRRLLEDPARVAGVREYVYGDSMRRIDWKATARTMTLQSRVYEASTTYTLMLFLNTTNQLDAYYGVHPELQELAICVAASVSSWALDQGYAVGLYANSIMSMPDDTDTPRVTQELEMEARQAAAQLKRRRIRLPAASSEEQRQRIMEVLARVQSYFGTSIEDVLLAERTHLPLGSTVVVITSTISEVLADTLLRMRQDGHAVSILFVGDAPPPVKLAGTTIYHLGGEAAWNELKASHIDLEESGTATGFHL